MFNTKLFLSVVLVAVVLVLAVGYYAVHSKYVVSANESNIAKLQAIAQQYNKTVWSMNQTIASLQSQINNLSSQLNNANAKEATFQKEASSKATNISTYQGTINLLKSEYGNLTGLYTSALNTISAKDAAIGGLSGTISSLKLNISNMNTTINSMNNMINSLNQNLSSLKNEYYLTDFVPNNLKDLSSSFKGNISSVGSLNSVSWNGSYLFIGGGATSASKPIAGLYNPSSKTFKNITLDFFGYTGYNITSSASNGSVFMMTVTDPPPPPPSPSISYNTTLLEYSNSKLVNATSRNKSAFGTDFIPTSMAYGDGEYLIVGYYPAASKKSTPTVGLFSYLTSNDSVLNLTSIIPSKSGEFLSIAYNGSQFAILYAPPTSPTSTNALVMYNPATKDFKSYNLTGTTVSQNGGIAWDEANFLVVTANTGSGTSGFTSGLFNPITHLYSQINSTLMGTPNSAAWNGTSFFICGFLSSTGPGPSSTSPLLYAYN